ncbi:MAG: hypothetical protein M0014_12845, partial [Actinomycetota bacterium]|nr:hypothetical protein [Actinomycetota bacterium]
GASSRRNIRWRSGSNKVATTATAGRIDERDSAAALELQGSGRASAGANRSRPLKISADRRDTAAPERTPVGVKFPPKRPFYPAHLCT